MTTETGTAVAVRERPALLAELERREPEIRKALPANIPSAKFVRVVMDAVNRNKDLLQCKASSVIEACQKAASDGLMLDGREAALVVYNTKVRGQNGERDTWTKAAQYIPMVMGLRKLVYNSGSVTSLVTGIVYQKELDADRFTYIEGTDPILRHVPLLTDDLGAPMVVYSVARMPNGTSSVEVMRWSEVMRVAKLSPKNVKDGALVGIWRDHTNEMARKTVMRRHAKSLPFSSQTADAFSRIDELYTDESGDTQPGEIAPPAGTKTRGAAAAKLAQAAGQDDPPHDRETGEIIDADHTPVEHETPADDEPVF